MAGLRPSLPDGGFGVGGVGGVASAPVFFRVSQLHAL